ncbi:hypothetical protein FRC12_013881 [Ceratobasidium sp. 428]|nr:hypothetical protein FRC12_013881 [Ceratobasidium sp. 428]
MSTPALARARARAAYDIPTTRPYAFNAQFALTSAPRSRLPTLRVIVWPGVRVRRVLDIRACHTSSSRRFVRKSPAYASADLPLSAPSRPEYGGSAHARLGCCALRMSVPAARSRPTILVSKAPVTPALALIFLYRRSSPALWFATPYVWSRPTSLSTAPACSPHALRIFRGTQA